MATNGNFLHASHPLIRTPILYVADVPGRVKWNHLVQIFQLCGQVRSGGKSTVAGNRKRWTILFTNVFETEMALATLQGKPVPGVNPPFILNLSHSPQLDGASHPFPLFPQFVHSDLTEHPLYKASAQDLFTWFRVAGPLASVQVNVNVGRAHPVCTVEYWEEVHANHARTMCQSLSKILEEFPQFSLRTYDPNNLYCAKLGATFKAEDLREEFSKFGQIIEARLVLFGVPAAYGFVSFSTREEAESAMIAMNGKTLNGSVIQVRYHEPKFQAVFRMPFKYRPGPGGPKPNTGDDAASTASTSSRQAKSSADEAHRRQEAARMKAEEEEAAQREREQRASAKAARVRKVRRAFALYRRIQAQSSVLSALHDIHLAENMVHAAQESLDDALRAESDVVLRVQTYEDEVREAERILALIRERRNEALKERVSCREKRVKAWNDMKGASATLLGTRQAEFLQRTKRKAAEKNEKKVFEETEEPVDEETMRQQELEESIRKMKEMRELEEADRRERLAKEQKETREREEAELRRQAAERLAQAERERREREAREEAERARKAAEQVARAEQERKEREEKEKAAREQREREEEELRRQKRYLEASAKEKRRCWERDCARWRVHVPKAVWTNQQSVNRFLAISVEFDQLRFDDAQPLTFESIPWPVLRSPVLVRLDEIDWQAVETFFAAAKIFLSKAEYKTAVEKAHRRFHPDRWRSRGLLNTVLDHDLRGRLEDAGNIVAQALGPIWRESRGTTN